MGFRRVARYALSVLLVLGAGRVLLELGRWAGDAFDLLGQLLFVVSFAALLVILASFWLEMGT